MSDLLIDDSAEPRRLEHRSPTAVWVFRGFSVLLFLLLSAQLWRLQIVEGRSYVQRGALNYLRTGVIDPQRGVIFDRHGMLLASNAPGFVVSITPADVPRARMEEIIIRVANELRVPPSDLQRVMDRRMARKDYTPFTPIPVRYDVDREAIYRLSERAPELPGVSISVESTRRYAAGPLTAHLLGYMGPIPADELDKREQQGYKVDDLVGHTGVEEWYEEDLRGVSGKRLYQVDVTGQEVAELRREPSRPGNNLQLTLDLELQRDVFRILQEALSGTSPSGAAIVMDPRSGEVLAMVSTPTFDNNIIGDPSREKELEAILTDEELLPMFPRAYAGTYAPGSVFKLVTGSAALEEGVATRDTLIESKGEMWVESEEYEGVKTRFPDNDAWGRQNFLQGLANSSNIYFFWLGGGFQEGDREIFKGLGIDRLAHYARAFGYGERTGLDLPGEKRGLVPDPRWKQENRKERWFKGDTYNVSIGQGDLLVSPLQVANVTNAIASGGTLYEPRLGLAELDMDGKVVKKISSRARQVAVDPRQLALMREAMEFAFSGPHLKDFRIEGLRAAGKTGTAEFEGPLDARKNLPTHGWFTGFAPADDPVVSVTVFVDRGGGKDAAPIGSRILRRYFNLPDVPPGTPPPTRREPAQLPANPPVQARRP